MSLTKATYSMIDGAPANVRDFGAVGDGVTDDTAAIQAALDSAALLVCGSNGDTYLVDGGLNSNIAGRTIDFTGCTVKLKNSAANKGVLRLTAVDSTVIGGEWDMNGANNATGSTYDHYAVLMSADGCRTYKMNVQDSYGIGIKAGSITNNVCAENNNVTNCAFGIYFDGNLTQEQFDNVVRNNYVRFTGTSGTRGIYISSGIATPPATQYWQKRFVISGNVVEGPTASSTAVAITARGTEGVISDNITVGCDIGISADISNQTTIVGNRCSDTNGAFSGAIEINGAYNTITGNVCVGGRYGVTGSTFSLASRPYGTQEGNTVAGNTFLNQTVNAVYFVPGVGVSGKYTTISGNVITTTTAVDGAIRLVLDCAFATISGNTFKGPGSGTVARAIFCDSVNSDISITGNTFTGWVNAAAFYNAGAVAQDRILFANNACAQDMPALDTVVRVSGSAIWGDNVSVLWNLGPDGPTRNWIDRKNNVFTGFSESIATPEAAVTAGMGSTFTIAYNSGSPTKFFVKETGTGNTGWVGK